MKNPTNTQLFYTSPYFCTGIHFFPPNLTPNTFAARLSVRFSVHTDPHKNNDRAEISLHSSPVFGGGVVNGIPPCRPLIFYAKVKQKAVSAVHLQQKLTALKNCPPGIRTPILRSRAACLAIRRGGKIYTAFREGTLHYGPKTSRAFFSRRTQVSRPSTAISSNNPGPNPTPQSASRVG